MYIYIYIHIYSLVSTGEIESGLEASLGFQSCCFVFGGGGGGASSKLS